MQLVGDERQCPICMDAMEPEPLQPEAGGKILRFFQVSRDPNGSSCVQVLDEDGDVEA